MKNFLLALIPLLFSTQITFAQKILAGKLLAAGSEKPIAFANIGILDKSVGTISNEDGSFKIFIPLENLSDTLLFSALGFKKKSIPVDKLNEVENVVYFEEQVFALDEIVIGNKSRKKLVVELGNRFAQGGTMYGDSVSGGAAIALLVENKYPAFHPDLEPPFYVGKAKLRIALNTMETFKIRLRLLTVDETGRPGKDLLHQNIVLVSTIKKGWLETDLSGYSIQIPEPRFYLVFEWIFDDKDRLALLNQYKAYKTLYPEKVKADTFSIGGEKPVYYSFAGLKAGVHMSTSMHPFSTQNYSCYFRRNSHGKWERSAAILTARITVSDRPFNSSNQK